MKLRIDRRELAAAATWVSGAIGKRPAFPILAGLKITAHGDGITLAGYNYDTSHTARLDAEVITEGEVLVSARFVTSILGALKAKQVELVVEDNRLAVTAGRSTYRASLLPIADYPTIPAMPGEHVGTVALADLAAYVEAVEHAVANPNTLGLGIDSDLGALYGIHLNATAGTLTIEATDRHRVGRALMPWGKPSKDFDAVVPHTALATALKGLSGDVQIAASSGAIGVTDGDRTVTTRLLDKQFPAVAPLFGKTYPITAEFDTAELLDAIKRSVMVSEEKDRVELEIGQGETTVRADSDVADGCEAVECESTGEITVVFNGSYLVHTLTAVHTGRVQFQFTKPTAAVGIEPVGDTNVAYVVMPRRSVR